MSGRSGSLTACSSFASGKVFSDEALEILRFRGNDTTVRSGVHVIENISYLAVSDLEQVTDVEIPEQLECVETFQFLEFMPQQAKILWDRLLARRSQPGRASLRIVAVQHIKSFEDVMYAHEDWVGTMDAMGSTKAFQARLMNPDFEDMRFTETLKESVLDMIDIRYAYLKGLDAVIKGPFPHITSRRLGRSDHDDAQSSL